MTQKNKKAFGEGGSHRHAAMAQNAMYSIIYTKTIVRPQKWHIAISTDLHKESDFNWTYKLKKER